MESGADSGNRVPLKYKIIVYVAAWLAALLATDPTCGFWALAYMFPLGLVAVFNQHLANDGGWGIFAACVAVYLVHAVFYFRSKTASATWLFYAALILMLIGNTYGCRSMLPR